MTTTATPVPAAKLTLPEPPDGTSVVLYEDGDADSPYLSAVLVVWRDDAAAHKLRTMGGEDGGPVDDIAEDEHWFETGCCSPSSWEYLIDQSVVMIRAVGDVLAELPADNDPTS